MAGFLAGPALVFVAIQCGVAVFYWIGKSADPRMCRRRLHRLSLFQHRDAFDRGYGDMHPQTHYGHFIATVELFTGIFSMSLDDRADLCAISRPNARCCSRPSR